jgi:hypothetical protein
MSENFVDAYKKHLLGACFELDGGVTFTALLFNEFVC